MANRAIDKMSIFLAELLGTAMLMFLGCMSCIPWHGPPNPLQTSLAFGMIVMVIIQAFGCVSGAHLNPAVTIAAFVYNLVTAQVTLHKINNNFFSQYKTIQKSFALQMACFYFIAQMFGAFMGYGLLLVITPEHIFSPHNDLIGVCVTRPHESLSPIQAVAIEYIATTILIALCCGCWDPRNADKQDTIPLKFGFALVAIGCLVVSEFNAHHYYYYCRLYKKNANKLFILLNIPIRVHSPVLA